MIQADHALRAKHFASRQTNNPCGAYQDLDKRIIASSLIEEPISN